MTENKNNEYNEIYEYIRQVDEKVEHNDKTLKFITAQHAEQMKELIGTRADGVRRFFEEAIKTQTEVVRNAYEEIISELKQTYEKDLKDREIERIRLFNQKEENLITSYDAKIELAKESAEIDCQKRINDSYLKAKTDFEEEKVALMLKCEKEKQEYADEISGQVGQVRQEYEERINEVNAWHEKNLRTKLHETEEYFKREIQKAADEAYANGKSDTEAWHDDIVRQKLETQAEYFQEEIKKLSASLQSKQENEERIAEINAWHEKNLAEKLEEMKNYYEGKIQQIWVEHEEIVKQKLETQAEYFNGEIEKAREEVKNELTAQMDEAARRNEEELKLFLDFYEAKIKPFKKFINIHETTDKRIKDIQQKLQRRFNKSFGDKDNSEQKNGKF